MKFPKKSKLIPLPKLIKKADTVFSLWVRKRDNYRCVLCGATERLTAGHLITRRKKSVRFDEMNVFCLCSTCNWRDFKDRAYHDFFICWFVKGYGATMYADLIDRAEHKKTWLREEVELIIQKYKT